MRISCPNCSAAYEVPDSALASGPRMLRCARCGHQFQAALPGAAAPVESAPPAGPQRPTPDLPPAPPPAKPIPAAAEPAPRPPMPPAPAESRRRGSVTLPPPETLSQARLGDAPASSADRFALAGWLLSFAVLGIAGYAMIAWRADIVAAWPPAQRVYMLIGLG